MRILRTLIILSNILIAIYSLIDIFRILNYIKKIKLIIILIKRIKKKNLGFFFKNLKKLFKYINLKTFYPIIFCLLFSDSITICESENNIHKYFINDKGEFIEINNDEEEIKIKKEEEEEEEYEEISDFAYYTILTIIGIIFFGSLIFILGDYFFGEGKPEPKKPILTDYQKQWLGKEDRLKTRICPHYIGRRNADTQNFDPEYVDAMLKKYREEYKKKHPAPHWYITQCILDYCYKIFKYY